jgi:hypothetical protein
MVTVADAVVSLTIADPHPKACHIRDFGLPIPAVPSIAEITTTGDPGTILTNCSFCTGSNNTFCCA